MRKKKKDIDDIQERIGQKEKKNLSKNNRRYLSGKENDTKLAKKEKRENTHSISSVENYSSNSSSDTNNSHKNKSQKSIKLKRKRNVRNESSSSETNKTKKKFGKRQINEHEECSKFDREQYQSNRHEKISKSLNEKKRERKERSDSDEGEDEDDNVRYKKERKKREDKKRENKKRENKKSESDEDEDDNARYKTERKKERKERSDSDEDEDEDDNARYKNDRNKLKRGRSDSSYMRKSREKERKHFRNKKYNKRSVSNSSNEFDKKKKDKSHYQKRDQNEKKKKNSDSIHDSRDYVHKMKREKHEHEHEHEHKFRRNGSSSGSGSSSGRSSGSSSGRSSASSGGGEEKEYDPFDEDLNKDVEINENLIEYAKKKIANITTEDIGRTGGIYIPPFKLERLQNEITNKKSSAYQKNEWMKLKKKINNIVNKVNIDNIGEICYELFECNLIRGKGIFSRAILHAQLSSPAFTNVFTCLLCIVNSKFPNIGLLTIHRTILHFRRAYKRCDKIACFNSVKFIAHMINQRILNEIVGLQLCSLLLQNITNDSIQVCTYFLAEVGQLYMNICRSGLDIIFDRLKDIIQEGNINVKTQYDIEKLWNYRKDYFKDFPTIIEDLDIISEEDKIIHEIDLLDENISNQEELNIFKEVSYEQYEKEDQEWADISRELLDVDDNSRNKQKDTNESNSDDITGNSQNENYSSNSSNSSTDSEKENTNDDSSNEDEEEEDENKEEIHDMTEQYLINLRKNIYLSIMSSLSFEECVHKLLKLTIKSGYEIEICNMLIDCCCMEKTFQKFYALQGERLCKLKIIYQENFEKCFENSYNTAHRLETSKLRNCSKFFAHLLYTDSISWRVFTLIKLTEEDTTSSTRIFTKILLQELTNNMGIKTFYFKINHPAISPFLSGLFPSDNSQNIRFSINFFTAIGLGALTSSMRKLLSTEGH